MLNKQPKDPISPLPLIPQDLLKKHRVLETFDTRFRACARLLQALWRESQGLPMGVFERPKAASRRIGSLLGATAARAGRNFLTPAVAHLVRHEVAYQEPGALIAQERLYGNLLSSMPLAFNLFSPLRFNLDRATKVIRSLMPDLDLKCVSAVWFEHSPGRLDVDLTGDRSAFDVAIIYERSDGRNGFIGFEVKYSEAMGDSGSAERHSRYDDLADASGLFKVPTSVVLRVNPLQQLFREHLLAQAALMRGDWAESTFVLVAPRDNLPVQNAAKLYAAHLVKPVPGQVAFVNITLEQFIEAIGWAGDGDYALALYERYCDWARVRDAVEAALRAKGQQWQLKSVRTAAPLQLVARAA
ncbi:PGN_0703 family putative restriction endonuclease [Sandarakinorhabdus rubra]|uniref:PGN_0703 family putative restriction endonuclease n=1 Tax=Sandarakinorhabdus rubra TaxID=2672568 RepID=UPI0013DB4D0A|nr:hypothetical protein [Sandarakinorhabdus rubra]